MTAGFDASFDGDEYLTVRYDDELMSFAASITVDEAEELVRNLKRAIKEAKG